MKKLICILFLMSFCLSNIFSASKSEKKELPQWTKDLRRTEIITFGSLPFVTIWTSMLYSGVKYGTVNNPLSKSSSNFTPQDQKNIMIYAGTACIALGLTDLIISIVKRNSSKKKTVIDDYQSITIMPLNTQTKIIDEEDMQEETVPQDLQEENIFPIGVESAIF